LFGYNFIAWQITGFIIHLLVQFFLLRILLKINRNIIAVLLVLLFSVMLAGIDMILWSIINSYMLFHNMYALLYGQN